MKSKEQQILDKMILDYEKKVSKLEDELAEYALEHNLQLSLGDYGNGRSLILTEDHWSGKDRGDWLYSSESC
jgi:hypothetical protein